MTQNNYQNNIQMAADKKSILTQKKLILALIILLIIPIWSIHYPPLDDYPSHLLSIFIMGQHGNLQYDFDQNFDVDWRQIPNMGSEIIIYGLDKVLPIEISGKIYLSLVLILFVFGIRFFLKQIDKDKAFLGLIAFLFAFNWYFHRGYLNFIGSIPFYFITLGFWIKFQRAGIKALEFVILMLLILATYFFHLIAWMLLIASLAFLSLTSLNWKNILKTGLAILPSFLLFVEYFLSTSSSAASRGMNFFSPIGNLKFALIHTFMNFSHLEILIYIVPLALLAYLFIISNIKYRHSQSPIERKLFWLVLILAVAYFILPVQMAAVWPFNLRLLIFALFLAVGTIPFAVSKLFANIYIATMVVFAVLNIGYVFYNYKQMSDKITVYTSGIDYVEANSTILPLTLNQDEGWISHAPMSTVWAYYHIAKGGVGPYLFNLPHGQIVNYSFSKNEVLPAPSLYPPLPQDYDPKTQSKPYDYVLLWGNDKDLTNRVEENFHLIFENGKLGVYQKIASNK